MRHQSLIYLIILGIMRPHKANCLISRIQDKKIIIIDREEYSD